jgi:hypothetical protein
MSDFIRCGCGYVALVWYLAMLPDRGWLMVIRVLVYCLIVYGRIAFVNLRLELAVAMHTIFLQGHHHLLRRRSKMHS